MSNNYTKTDKYYAHIWIMFLLYCIERNKDILSKNGGFIRILKELFKYMISDNKH